MYITSDYQRYEWETAVKKDPSSFDEVLVKDPKFAKSITWALVTQGIPFRKINYGCGVLLFLPNKKVCKHCGGRG